MTRHLAFLLLLVLGAGSAFAQSGETINQLSPGAVLQGTEQIPMYQAANPAVTTTPAAVATYVGGAPRNGINGWVNIKDPRFGATGNGRTDDTAAIQAAIDYAFTNNLSAVYCPRGNYLISESIWLDPPNNMRLQTFTGQAYIDNGAGGAGTTLHVLSGSLSNGSTAGLEVGSHVYGSGIMPDTVILSGGPLVKSAGTFTVNNAQQVGSGGLPIRITGNDPSNPTATGFSFSFFGDPSNNQSYPSCRIFPNFNNGHAIEVGTGAGMLTANLAIQGAQPSGLGPAAYRGGQASNGVGIAINGGNAGASVTLIRDASIINFYTLINTDTNNNGNLSDVNTFERISGGNAYIGINIQGQNTLINHAIDAHFVGVTIGYNNVRGNAMTVNGGSVQPETGLYNCYAMSNVSSITNTGTTPGGDGPFTFTATLSLASNLSNLCTSVTGTSIDPTGFGFVNVPQVYSWWGLSTRDFGVIPITLATTCLSGTNASGTGGAYVYPCWNPSTKAATFQLYPPWVFGEFGSTDLSTTTNLSAEIQAVTTVYATERVYTARGAGITLNGVTTENGGTCATIIDNLNLGTVNVPTRVKDLLNLGSAYNLSRGNTAYKYCQRTMPVIEQESPTSPIIVDGGDWASTGAGWQTIETVGTPSNITIRGNAQDLNVMFRDGNGGGYGWGQVTGITNTWESEARGLGTLDQNYSLPSLLARGSANLNSSEIATPFCGVEPCPWALPNFSASLLSASDCPSGNIASCGALPTFYYIIPVACRTVFKSVDWNTGGVPPSTPPSTLYLRSNSCPGYSWGQNITDATVSAYLDPMNRAAANFTGSISGTALTVSSGNGITVGDYLSGAGVMAGTYITGGSGRLWTVKQSQTVGSETMYATAPVSWSHIGQSPVLYLDANTLSLMFPGLGFSLDSGDGSGSHNYVVTGVYQDLGYVTVIRADQNAGDLLTGNTTQVYSCTSRCTIGQAPFSWRTY